jgi:hypothetical protein
VSGNPIVIASSAAKEAFEYLNYLLNTPGQAQYMQLTNYAVRIPGTQAESPKS